MLRLEPQLILEEDYRAEFRCIVLNIEAVLLTFDDSMTSADTNVVYSYLTLVATPQLKF